MEIRVQHRGRNSHASSINNRSLFIKEIHGWSLWMTNRPVAGCCCPFTSFTTSASMTVSRYRDGQTTVDTWTNKTRCWNTMLVFKSLSSSSWWEIGIVLQLSLVCFAVIRAGLLRQHLSPWRYDVWVFRVSVSALSSCFNIGPSPDVTVKTERGVLKLQHVVGRNTLSKVHKEA